jgi:uncharacterized protein
MMLGVLVDVVDFKWGGELYRSLPMTRLGADENGTWLWCPRGTTTTNHQERRSGSLPVDFLTLVPAPAAWWNATWMFGGEIELYVDIVAPARWVGDARVEVIDLDLDVVRDVSGRVFIDDEDEFEEHSARYAYPAEVVEAARRSADVTFEMVRDRVPPFDTAPAAWLSAARR